jgi:hypothetical protein
MISRLKNTMTKTTVALSLLLSASAAFAQTADISMRFHAERTNQVGPLTRFRAGETIVYRLFIRNAGPAVAKNVVVDMDFLGDVQSINGSSELTCTKTRPVRCTAAELATTSFDRQVLVLTTGPSAAGDYTAFATMRSDTPDPIPSNNAPITVRFTVVADPDLIVRPTILPGRAQPLETLTTNFLVNNLTPAATAHDVRVLISPIDGASVTAVALQSVVPGATCSVTGDSAVCTVPQLDSTQTLNARVTLRAPERDSGGSTGVQVSATSAEGDFNLSDNVVNLLTSLVRQLVVSNTNDSGAGSLRQALIDSQVLCAREFCRVAFRIGSLPQEKRWFTISPTSPLPRVGGIVDVDGSTQTAFGGDTNPDGPEIEIRGDLQKEGDGLHVDSACEVMIRGLSIGGFPRHAIASGGNAPLACVGLTGLSGPLTIANNYIGLDPTGKALAPNFRGIFVGDTQFVTIRDNVIGANARSAIFMAFQFTTSTITRNRIGLTTDDRPAPNGASGIYIHGEGTINDNIVANSGEFGIAVDSFLAPALTHVGMHHNLIFGNQYTAIDHGLDLETPNHKDTGPAIPNKPVLISAVYLPATNTTVIRGRIDTDPISTIGQQYVLELFASNSLSKGGHAQAERYLGSLTPKTGHEDFEFTAKGDLRGQWIAATSSRSFYNGFRIPDGGGTSAEFLVYPEDTSELSDPVQVR